MPCGQNCTHGGSSVGQERQVEVLSKVGKSNGNQIVIDGYDPTSYSFP